MKAIKTIRTPFLRALMKACAKARAQSLGIELPVADPNAPRDWKRREFLATSGKAMLALSAAALLPACGDDDAGTKEYKIAIIGGGIAGLNAAYTLKKGGVFATVYESSGRLGGRMFTGRGTLGAGINTELGGEFIDTIHEDILALAQEFGLELIDTLAPSEDGLEVSYYFNGQFYTDADIVASFNTIVDKLAADANTLPEYITYDAPGGATAFDNISITDYLDSIAAPDPIKTLLIHSYTSEYGLDAADQTALNLLALIPTEPATDYLHLFGDSDERYKILLGNDTIPTKIAEQLTDRTKINHKLTKVAATGDKWTLTFSASGSTLEVVADYVIMALPFTILRTLDIAEAGFPALKLQAINELGYGVNCKIMMGFDSHYWRTLNKLGVIYSDTGLQTAWDSSQLQPVDKAGYSILLGGQRAVDSLNGSPADQVALYLPKIEEVFPGVTAQHNGNTARMHWQTYPHNLGSYICYRKNQWTVFGGVENETVGTMFFAGEHTSDDFAGFMNGGAESGRKAAEGIIAAIG